MGEQHDRSHALRSDGGALSRTAPPALPSRVRQEIHTKLSAARTRLILERPFIGALVMHLPLAAAGARHCPTIATDARALYFNPDYIAGLTLAETQFVLAHEALHCALAHFARRSHRMRKRWDVACDHAVNLILIQEGMRPPRGVLANTAFLGLTAEEIYPLIPPDTGETPLDEHLFEPFSGAFSGIDHPPHRGQLPGPGGAKPAAKAEEIDEGWDDAGDAPSSHEPRAPECVFPGGARRPRRGRGARAALAEPPRLCGPGSDARGTSL